MNELDKLFIDSLRKLSEEFQQRETQLQRSFVQQMNMLRKEQDALAKRLNELATQQLTVNEYLLQVASLLDALNKSLDA